MKHHHIDPPQVSGVTGPTGATGPTGPIGPITVVGTETVVLGTQLIPTYRFALREDLKDQKQFLPTKAEPLSTGWDVRAAFTNKQGVVLFPFDCVKIPLGIRGFCPPGWWYELKPRSSTFGKKNLHCLYGTIDESYEGELLLACQYLPPHPGFNQAPNSLEDWKSYCIDSRLTIDFGDAVGQIIPVKRQDMTVVEVTNDEYTGLCSGRQAIRGAGGFGSTGK